MTQQDYLDLSPRDAELSRLYGTARRRGSLVWAANIFWVFLLILLVISFVSTVNDFKKTEIKLNNMEKAASDLLHDLNAMKAELEGVQTLQEKHTKVFAARLLEEEGVGEKLSNQEKEFLEAVRVEYVEIIESSTVNNTENISEILFLANDSFFEMFTNKANGDEEGTISLARKSVEYYMRALNLGLGAAASYYRLGVAQRFALDPSASIEALKIALQSTEADEKLHYDVLHSLGLSYLMAGDHVKAHTSMDDAIKIVRRAQQRDEGRGDKSGGSGRPVSGKEWWLNKEVETIKKYWHRLPPSNALGFGA